MPVQTSVALIITLAIAMTGFLAVYLLRRRTRIEPPVVTASASTPAEPNETTPTEPTPFSTEATIDAAGQVLKLAFSVTRFDYQIFADHAHVMELVDQALGDAAEQLQYFPRRPRMLPKLLQALNDEESTRHALVRLILEDPTLAGTTLKRANNAFYRMSAQPVESLDRAVALLGVEGLRGLVSTAILQPVFRLPKGFFDRFADVSWEQAQRCAASAHRYAQSMDADDPFVAQVLGVLPSLASLVLFRMTLEKYRQCPNVLPRPEVFVRVLQKHRSQLALEIARTWYLSEQSFHALEEQIREVSPSQMSALGRALYYGELAGTLAVATHHGSYSPEGAKAMLIEQGLAPTEAAALLSAADHVDV
jgi:HD-like signal output (HDOD) protein